LGGVLAVHEIAETRATQGKFNPMREKAAKQTKLRLRYTDKQMKHPYAKALLVMSDILSGLPEVVDLVHADLVPDVVVSETTTGIIIARAEAEELGVRVVQTASEAEGDNRVGVVHDPFVSRER
jgi:hypothetical protein